MKFDRLDALERETPNPDLRAIEGTSLAANKSGQEESATALAVTLSDVEIKRGRMTVQDLIRHASSKGLHVPAVIAGADRLLR